MRYIQVYTGWVKKVVRLFVIHTVHEQWSVRRHDCVISDIKFIMKTFLLELEPVGLVCLLYINLSVNAICGIPFSTISDLDNLCFLMSWMGYFLLTHPVRMAVKYTYNTNFSLMHNINAQNLNTFRYFNMYYWHLYFGVPTNQGCIVDDTDTRNWENCQYY